jgi:excisionase family DNA binding protein
MENLISAQEAAERLGVSFWTVYRLARNGQLASIRLGRRRLFAEEDLERLIRDTRNARETTHQG